MSIRPLVENIPYLDYKALTLSLIQEIGVHDSVNWDAVIPANVQQNLFGGEILRLFSDHKDFANQKDIRTISLIKGETSQLLILFAQLKDDKLSKSNIERITKKFIGGQAAERYVVWYLGNPDNTQFKVVLSGKEGKKIVLKNLPFGTNQPYYKTYDFILDEVHKKVSPLFIQPNEIWKALWKSFDISVVNKKFYEDIKKSFDKLINDTILSGAIRIVEARKQFTVRLIGRIIFCWFLKKKSIIDEVVLSSSAVNKYEDYYGEFLEKLFFDVFNTPQIDRRKDLPAEIKNYPFLNGGLFEDQKGDFGDYKGYINISNEWFEDLFKNKLEKYNFTIDENTSSNSEIAIDPEMLGRIFENLLAEQNPETQESARKSTGSYYTPREIVDYMVEQSLIEYLKSNVIARNEETKQSTAQSHSELVSEFLSQNIEDFVHTEELPEDLGPFSEQILEKLNSVKVLDPACGSGAFPIGMLQKLIALKLQISPFGKGGTQGGSKTLYTLKLQTILNSIYGCDIQPMAVELSRLRCWLSLIIDEPVDKKKENWGIENLPNLDFKFVCVNTLIGLPKMVEDSLGTSADDFEKLKELRTEFFTASSKRKIKIEQEFKALQDHIAEKQREWSTKNTEAVTMLINWNPFKVDETSWFDPFWMFGINDGFDIVIGNPPYLESRSSNFTDKLKDKIQLSLKIIWENDSKYISRGSDLLIYFYVRSLSLVSPNGWTILITQNAWLDTDYGKSFQDFLIRHTQVKKIIDSDFKHFESKGGPNINTVITIFAGNKTDENNLINFINYNDSNNYFETQSVTKGYSYGDKFLKQYKWGILLKSQEPILNILKKINSHGKRLDELKYIKLSCGQGLNLPKSYFVPKDFIEKNNLLNIALPIFTSDDGAPYVAFHTAKYLLPTSCRSSINKNSTISFFDENSTKKKPPLFILPRGIGRHFCAYNKIGSYSASFVEIYIDQGTISKLDILRLWLFFNSSLFWLIRELSGRKNLGGGMLKAEATDIKSFPLFFEFNEADTIETLFNSLNKKEVQSPLNEIQTEHHQLIDKIVFNYLKINEEQQVEIIYSLKRQILTRSKKSKT